MPAKNKLDSKVYDRILARDDELKVSSNLKDFYAATAKNSAGIASYREKALKESVNPSFGNRDDCCDSEEPNPLLSNNEGSNNQLNIDTSKANSLKMAVNISECSNSLDVNSPDRFLKKSSLLN